MNFWIRWKNALINHRKSSGNLKILKTKSGGELTRSEMQHFGGPYKFWEKLLAGGVGSNRLIYQGGIPEIELLKRNIEGELVFINFELLPNGFIIRANCNQRKLTMGLKISDIESITMKARRLTLHVEDGIKIVHEGDIEIRERYAQEFSKFSVVASEFKDLVQFFLSKQLSGKFKYTVVG